MDRRDRNPGMGWLAGLLLVLLLGITGIGIGSSYLGWPHPLELWSHFQLQYLILGLGSLGILALTRRWLLIGIGCVLVAFQSVQILPWYLSPPLDSLATPLDRPPLLRVVLANINTRNQAYDRVIGFVQQESPDIVLLMEVSENWQGPLVAIQDQLPYSFNQTGNYLFSRYPLQDPRSDYFGTDRTAALLTQITVQDPTTQDRRIALIGAHPLPPIRPELFHSRNRHLDGIAQTLGSVSQPTILMGDLNITPWSPYYRRLIRITGLNNTRLGFGILPSWPTPGTYPLGLDRILQLPIDHCLVSAEFETLEIRVGPDIGSDHRPVIVDLAL